MSRAQPRVALLAAALTLLLAGFLGSGAASAAPSGGFDPGAALERAGAGRAQLSAEATWSGARGGTVRRYQQRIAGLSVLGAEAVVVAAPGAAAELVLDDTVAGLAASQREPDLGRRMAIRLAARHSDTVELRAAPRARLAIEPRDGRLVWEVRLATATPSDLRVLVDAGDGRVLASRDLLRTATASAALYLPNPVTPRGTADGLRDRDDRDSVELAALRSPVTLERLEGLRGCLRGQFAEAGLGPGARRVCRRSAAWEDISRSRGAFEALMAYFHVDRARAYIDSLALSRSLRSKPQEILVNATPEDNSFYSPFRRTITLGTGGVDDGEDGDVIVHEYGHSVQDQQRRFFGDSYQSRAIGEGFGDYLAAVLSSLSTGGDERADTCMFEWDAISYTSGRCARRTDNELTEQAAKRRCGRSFHCLGQTWASALWRLRTTLGADEEGRWVADRLVLESQFLYTRRTGFADAARALLAADDLLYAGAHRAAIEAEMRTRGFCGDAGC